MHIDPALLSPLSALLGALIGGATSLLAAIYTQRGHDRIQRIANEISKRETVYADFVMYASKSLLNAYTHDKITRRHTSQQSHICPPLEGSGSRRACPQGQVAGNYLNRLPAFAHRI